ncbi:hypothetical protein J6590_064074 [Homalodisca vitripennis]|nr:hypothetical protein J6590_064074 [Homalodisca vitripennis]
MDGETADTGLQELRLTASTTGYIKVSLQQTEIHHGYGYGWRGSRHRSARIETHGKHYRLHQGFTATNRNTSWIRLWMERQRTQKYIMDTVMDGEAADTGLQVLRLTASTTGYIKVSLQQTEIHHGYGYGWRGSGHRQKYIMDTVMDGEAADTGLQVLILKASTTGYIKVSLQQTEIHHGYGYGWRGSGHRSADGEAADTGLQVLRLKASTTGYIKVSLQQTEMHHGYGYGWRGSGHRSAGSETQG